MARSQPARDPDAPAVGLAYVASVAISSIAAFYLAAHTTLGWVFASGITGLGIAWVLTTTMAIVAVRRGLIEQHQDWMIPATS